MIGGIIMILTAIWVYQTLIKAKTSNLLLWVAGCALLFFVTEFVATTFCIEILDGLNGKDISDNYERDLTSVGDRVTQEGKGDNFLVNSLCELFPSAAGILAVAFIRTKFILKEALTAANLFSGLKEMFIAIKDSFKTNSN